MDGREAKCPKCGTVVPLPRSMADDADPAGGLILTCQKCREQFDYPSGGIGLGKWFQEPGYKACQTVNDRGGYIITKLLQMDTQRLRTAWFKAFPGQTIFKPATAGDLTKEQWRVILEGMGASPEEVREVQERMVRSW